MHQANCVVEVAFIVRGRRNRRQMSLQTERRGGVREVPFAADWLPSCAPGSVLAASVVALEVLRSAVVFSISCGAADGVVLGEGSSVIVSAAYTSILPYSVSVSYGSGTPSSVRIVRSRASILRCSSVTW